MSNHVIGGDFILSANLSGGNGCTASRAFEGLPRFALVKSGWRVRSPAAEPYFLEVQI
jgi:hypothetical protein